VAAVVVAAAAEAAAAAAAVVVVVVVVVVAAAAAAGRETTQLNMHNSKLQVKSSSMSESLQTIPHLLRLLKIWSCGT